MIEAHYSNDLKVKRPIINATAPPDTLPTHRLFVDSDATKKMQRINTDIYTGVKKEKKTNEFNKSLYFKIFGGIALFTAGIAGIRKIRNFFRKS